MKFRFLAVTQESDTDVRLEYVTLGNDVTFMYKVPSYGLVTLCPLCLG